MTAALLIDGEFLRRQIGITGGLDVATVETIVASISSRDDISGATHYFDRHSNLDEDVHKAILDEDDHKALSARSIVVKQSKDVRVSIVLEALRLADSKDAIYVFGGDVTFEPLIHVFRAKCSELRICAFHEYSIHIHIRRIAHTLILDRVDVTPA